MVVVQRPKKQPNQLAAKKQPKPAQSGAKSNVAVSKVSGEVVQRRGKEKEEVRPKRPSKLKQVILEERNEKFQDFQDTVGADAEAVLDKRLEHHRSQLLKSGVKLALRTENQRMMERLKTVPKVRNESASTAAAVHLEQRREYCRQLLTDDLDVKLYEMLSQLVMFQNRLRATNPLKAKMRRRLIVGFREVSRAVNLGKAKCVVMAPNIEDINSPSTFHE